MGREDDAMGLAPGPPCCEGGIMECEVSTIRGARTVDGVDSAGDSACMVGDVCIPKTDGDRAMFEDPARK